MSSMSRGMRCSLVVATSVLVAGAVAAPALAIPEGPPYPSPEWGEREAGNFARTQEAAAEQQDPAFQERWRSQGIANFQSFVQRQIDDPAWRTTGNLCETWGEQCTGDPFYYPGTDPFYDDVGEVVEVAFYDDGGARLSGRVWKPRSAGPGAGLPGVVMINGSVQAPETLYWWFARDLVSNGYVVLTFDPRGQGRSDNQTPDGQQGSNANPDVFVTNLIDAIDFFRSTPTSPFPNADRGAAATTDFNPFWEAIDPDRLGAVGHSLGATGVSVVQGIQPWPGVCCTDNPIDVIVAWDNLALATSLAGHDMTPRVPAMGQSGDYFLTPSPFTEPPDPDGKRQGFLAFEAAEVPAFQVNIQGGTHYEWSLIPSFPATAWDPGGPGGWGNPLARHYSLAWLDRWLKEADEPGYADADARLLDDAGWVERMSFYYRGSRNYPDRTGAQHVCSDIRAGCTDTPTPNPAPVPPPPAAQPAQAPSLPSTGGGAAAVGLLALAAAGIAGRGPRRR